MWTRIYATVMVIAGFSLIAGILHGTITSSKTEDHAFIMPLDNHLQEEHVRQLYSFIQQADNWSCGYRVICFAAAIENGLKYPEHFEEILEQNLKNEQLLDSVYKLHCQEHPLSNLEIQAIAQKLGIADRLTVLDYEHEITLLGSITIQCPPNIPDQTKQELLTQERKIKLKETLSTLISQVKQAPQAAYIVCGTEGHWILYAFVNLPGRPAMLYLIDSGNGPLRPQRQAYLDFLLPYLNTINSNKLYTVAHALWHMAHIPPKPQVYAQELSQPRAVEQLVVPPCPDQMVLEPVRYISIRENRVEPTDNGQVYYRHTYHTLERDKKFYTPLCQQKRCMLIYRQPYLFSHLYNLLYKRCTLPGLHS
jgi:uncharacterized protein YfkK (UPF0435 family)